MKEESPIHKGTITIKNNKNFLKILKRKQSLELAVYKSDCYQWQLRNRHLRC